MVRRTELIFLFLICVILGCKNKRNVIDTELLLGKWNYTVQGKDISMLFKQKAVLIDYHNSIGAISRGYSLNQDTLSIESYDGRFRIVELTKTSLIIKSIDSGLQESVYIIDGKQFTRSSGW